MQQFSAVLLLSFLTVALGREAHLAVKGHGAFVKLKIVPYEITRGILLKNIDSQIVSGNYAAPDQFPYFGNAILYRRAALIFCGSSLISNHWVVTAAHCMLDVTGAQIYFGSIDRLDMKTSRSAEGYFAHESFDVPPLANDIAIIKLTSAVPLSASIQPILLPAHSEKTIDFNGASMTACGFGKTATEYPRYLQYTSLTGLSNAECLRSHWVFLNTMLCGKGAGNTGSSVCSGDSGSFEVRTCAQLFLGISILGGPLTAFVSGTVTLVGISSYVQTNECFHDVQGFTRVDQYLDWINANTGIQIRS